jgi:uncharacterized protein
MNSLKNFDLDISSLALGKHSFEFTINDEFFSHFEQDIVSKGKILSKIMLEKTDLLMRVKFSNQGVVELTCDRTIKPFDYQLKSENTLTFNFSDRNEEIDDALVLLKRDTINLNMANYIYEYIILAIPLKKIHPDYVRDDEEENQDNILIYSSVTDEEEPEDKDIDILDPRWEALKKLKDSL